MHKITKNKRILVQASVFILLIFSIGIIVSAILTYRNFYKLSISILKEESDIAKVYARKILQEYSALPWLLDYWEKNYKTLDVSLKSHNDDIKKYNEIPQKFLLHRTNITSEQAASLSPEEQKLFAEFCYKEILDDFYYLKKANDLQSLYLVKLLPGKDCFVFFHVQEKNFHIPSLGDIFILPFDIAKHPLIKTMYATGKDPSEFEIRQVEDDYLPNKTDYLFCNYALLKEKNEDLCHLVLCDLVTDIRGSIFNEVLEIAGVNMGIFVFLGFIVISCIYFFIISPLLKIQKSVKDYIINKDKAVTISRFQKIKSQNEVGQLVDDLSLLVIELEHYVSVAVALSAEKARIDYELSLAARIQESALSKDFPDVKEFKLFASMTPAKEVGG